MIKQLKKKLKPTRDFLWGVIDYQRDYRRFRLSNTAFGKPQRHEQWKALLTIDYHRIEKGLALKDMRPGFGKEVLDRLITNIPRYVERYGHDELTDIAVNSLKAYAVKNAQVGQDVSRLETFIDSYRTAEAISCEKGGTMETTASSILERSNIDAEAFFFSRYSVRHFSQKPISHDLIEQALTLAGKTPSVCNRQSGRAFYTDDPEIVAKALSFQNGNRGFGHQVPGLLILCSDFDIFEKVDERNQGWIDGGLFAMSVIYALHAVGLGSCMLNWSVRTKRDRELRACFNIPESYGVICMAAVGHLPDRFDVAQSPRRPASELLLPLTLKEPTQ